MAVLPICISGEPVLHEVAAPVTDFNDDLRALVESMYETMDLAPGVGLAAPQVGIGQRLFVWSYDEQDEGPARGVAINPTLWVTPPSIEELDEETEIEGCLSFPGERFPLRRSDRVRLEAVDLSNTPFTIEASGWYARIFQHEYDHLNGLLYVDRLVHPHGKAAHKALKRNSWGSPGQTWTPGVDNLEG
ncbi:peptide deformylase [Klugiella xanthotipulae]|uniref:Peptide deformylase n=1 Tax=Klugiella xanthotipulae TaxID=244735 RepID=A0A543HS10_9MICO|nr:peptide deformylase [Klugiella xanthotipulae]TQM61133.1 peptide deformylase [Klugiella xanthotipulae]